MSWRDYVMMGLGVCLFIGVPVIFMTMVVVVGCGQKYPSVSHTLTFNNIPQTAFQCLQTRGRSAGQRCLKAHPEARKTFGPNGLDKDMGDCLYDYPEIGFQKSGFYLPEKH